MEKEQALKIASEHAGKSTGVIVTSDGTVFFAPQRGHAEFHAKEKGLNMFEFKNEELNPEEKEETKSATKPKKNK